ncbi:unnamed protein product [Plasmodium vivax]|uniref:(malaria parasite P. vivax) hypothetical protein n=1 Tax=Plasmodium vivax TaxID=5855 RepID=A0A8S4H5R1_PLAVI|nr:unnamed protein product [Plasmodium vivax]
MSYKTQYDSLSLCGEYKSKINYYSAVDNPLYDNWCDDIFTLYNRYSNFKERHTCRQVMHYLSFISSHYISTYGANGCKFLYYWINNYLLDKKENYDESFKLYKKFVDIHEKNISDPHICNRYTEDTNKITLEKTAKLTELYDTINNDNKIFDCVCAKKCSDLYIEYVKECNNNYDHDYCRELENFKQKYDKNMASLGTCIDIPNILPSAIKHELHLIIIIPMIILTVLSFLIFALYKFTPIGSRITHRKRRKNVFIKNKSDSNNKLSPTSAETRSKVQNIAYNMAYDSTTYS